MELTAEKREVLGKNVKTLRRQGLVPAELYGHGLANMHLSVPVREFAKIFKQAGSSTVVALSVSGKKHSVIIHDVQKDFVSGELQHVDFYEVRMDEKMTARVPLEFTGEAPALKEKGGILNKSMSELEVEALPADMPHHILVDVSMLADIGQSVYVSDLKLPKGVTTPVDPETAIISIAPAMKEEEAAPAAAVDVSAVKVEGEEKKQEREAKKAAEGESKS